MREVGRFLSVPLRFSFALLYLSAFTAAAAETPADTAQAQKDARIVEALLRLKQIDVNRREDLKAAVLRHLEPLEGSEQYVDLVDKLKLRGVEDELLRVALANPESNVAVQAATLLLERGDTQRFQRILAGEAADEPGADDADPLTDAAARAATVLGLVGGQPVQKLLRPLVTGQDASRAARNAAAAAVARTRSGQQYLLELVSAGQLPQDLNFTVANALFASADPKIRQAAAKYLELPAAAEGSPLPPVSQLARQTGDAARGVQLFNDEGTCAKCHKVKGEGKDVGPDLSEIGGKLSPEAMFVSILDPSAGISHNYETYTAVLGDGSIVSGLLVTRSDEEITLRTAEAIDKTLDSDSIDELIKSEVSLMPADLQKLLSVQDLVDLVAYMGTLRKG